METRDLQITGVAEFLDECIAESRKSFEFEEVRKDVRL